jgi:predicted RNase H-like HicB family nuclease
MIEDWKPHFVKSSDGVSFEVRTFASEEVVAVGCSSLPGCYSQGDTEQEPLENIVDAIELYLEVTAELETTR